MAERAIYLTREGFKKFDEELEHLRTVRRPQVAERIRLAKELTDTVDNAEYDDAKSEQGFIEGRIQELEGTLASAQIIGEGPHPDYVDLGSRVTVKDADGIEEAYLIVGSVEADPRHGLISNESPVGRALLGKKVNEEVQVNVPKGLLTLKITKIS